MLLRALQLLAVAALLAGCASTSGDVDPDPVVDAGLGDFDAGSSDAGQPAHDAGGAGGDAGHTFDGGGANDAGGPPDAGQHFGWAAYTLEPGAHAASVARNGASRPPLSGLVVASARTYRFIFDLSARYVLTNPAQPNDQLDWNKLPGLSDCGELDLARDGLMFGWRWRPDLSPPVLEVAQYANNGGTHLYPTAPLFALDESELRAETPLQYELVISGTEYRFRVSGIVGARTIDESRTFPRRCTSSTSSLKWASGFYFGGTSTAPQRITGWVQE